ncbi:hypothetical protein NA57DRAFT_72791 [Rhizodiscina lignyota]|uniref:Uncharacterized protein n=1 Tax=Rhizodiscina lignyota TaxID=1504668 RepID=A0A9P4IL96_9PEZI|nr:hypothetical protein NA57DRAFT_72791 [Rhizodiscina lignyota]
MEAKHSNELNYSDGSFDNEPFLVPQDIRLRKSGWCSRVAVLRAATAASITLLVLTVLSFTIPQFIEHRHNIALEAHNCGNSTKEALANDCVFDVLNFAWTPRACFDVETYEESYNGSLERGPFLWSLGRRGADPITQDLEQLGRLDVVYTTHRFHVEHCAYSFKVLNRAAVNNDAPLPRWIGFSEHSEHCERTLVMGGKHDWEKIDLQVTMIYGACGRMSRLKGTEPVFKFLDTTAG